MISGRNLEQWLQLLERRHPVTIDLGLERVRDVWRRLGAPVPAAHVFTVAGTNGKGSTVSYLENMLGALGLRQGTYTSPHLLRYNERVRILGEPVGDSELVAAFEQIEQVRGSISLTYFEFGTLAALMLLARSELEFAVLEVGLGGRLDAVNIIDADCAVITPIGLDHQEYLGPDREAIGREKAGIMRAGRPVICGEPEPPASLVRRAQDLGASLFRLGREFEIAPAGAGLRWRMGMHALEVPLPAMPGPHQANNMATALAALSLLLPEALAQSGALTSAIRTARVPGRMQAVAADPRVLVDVGHNPHAAAAIAAALRAQDAGPVSCVLGMLRDKDAAGVVAALLPEVRRWYCAGLTGDRGRSGEDLAAAVAGVAGRQPIFSFPDVASALRAALQQAGSQDRILVFGSFGTAAEALTLLEPAAR